MSLVVRLHEHRRELLITRPVGYVRRTIALVGLPNVVPVYETLEAALRALAAGGPLIPPPFELGRRRRRPAPGSRPLPRTRVRWPAPRPSSDLWSPLRPA